MGPKYKHDCDECKYMGPMITASMIETDLYACWHQGMPTWVLRFGDDGPDYTSNHNFDFIDRWARDS